LATGPRERAQSFLTDDHIERVVSGYEKFADAPGFARVVTLAEIRAKDGNLSIPLYVAPETSIYPSRGGENDASLETALSNWLESTRNTRKSLRKIIEPS